MNKQAEWILKQTVEGLNFKYGESLQEASPQHLHICLSDAAMALLKDGWQASYRAQRQARRAFYFSAEYLIGRSIYSNLYNMGILKELKRAFLDKDVDLEELEEIEDAALGNGGLGRLAACFLDSAATEELPLMGYGLRYRFGLFKQSFSDCEQVEQPDDWTKLGDPWSCRRDDLAVKVDLADESVVCVSYDMPIVGYKTDTVGTLRLWQCEGSITNVTQLFR